MFDLHSHILYDLDDGAQTLDEALAMGRMAAADGVRLIAATPHSPPSLGSRHYDSAIIRERVASLNTALSAEQIAIEVVAGTEICYDGNILERLQRGALLPYGASRAILLELPYESFPPALTELLFNLQVAGYRVVLAHPERIADVQHDPNRLLPLIERGVLMQLTAGALLGEQGERLRQTAETLLIHGMIHILASDAHGLPPRRPPLLGAARARAAALVGEALADTLVDTIPAAVLAGHQPRLPPPRPIERQRSRWWRG